MAIHNTSIKSLALLALAAPMAEAAANSVNSNPQSTFLYIALYIAIALVVLQSLVIIRLQRSRKKHKAKKETLKYSQRALETNIIERTQKLKKINNQLYEEIAKHEITEELLRETQEYLHSIINSMPSVLIGVTRQGYITHWNAAAERKTHIATKDALGQYIFDIYLSLPVEMELISEAIDLGLPRVSENIKQGSGRETTHCDITIYPLLSSEVTGAVIRIDDVTVRVHAENMMIQNEKMMSLGELAAGMAHEINNPLSAILNGVQNIYRRTSPSLNANQEVAEELNIELENIEAYLQKRNIFEFLDGIRDAGERSAKIVSNMLAFSRDNYSSVHAPTNITDILEQSIELVFNTATSDDENKSEPLIHREYENNIPLVHCSAAEIQQVAINLLRNANQALSRSDSKEPQITLRAMQQGNDICFEVEDNGPGMPEVIHHHIFEPFFTTKDVGKGTGLGLSISYFIITDHHDGTIEVDTSPGKGSRFTVSIPLLSNAEPS